MGKTVIFVCYGNICRSPIAEGIFRQKLGTGGMAGDNVVLSSGISAGNGPAHHFSISASGDLGVDISRHKAKQFTKTMAKSSDFIFTMDEYVKDVILDDFPEVTGKVYTLKEFAYGKGARDLDVEDPYGRPFESFQECAEDISETIEVLWDKIKIELE